MTFFTPFILIIKYNYITRYKNLLIIKNKKKEFRVLFSLVSFQRKENIPVFSG